jgi:cytoskeleton protein RodZ
MDVSSAERIDGEGRDLRPTTLYRPRPDGELDPAGEAGWYLQREREKRGESTAAAGEAAGIHPYHLEAIEDGDLTRLPQRLEALEMIGSYAQSLGFDPEPLLRHYATFLPRPRLAPDVPHPANPPPLSSAKVIKMGSARPRFSLTNLPGGAGGIVASCLGAVLLFAIATWTIQSSRDPLPAGKIAADAMPTASTNGQAPNVKVAESRLEEDQPSTVLPGGQTTMGVAPLSEEDAAGAGLNGLTTFLEQNMGDKPTGKAASDAPLGQIAANEDAVATPEGRLFGSANQGSRLILKAKAPVWVRIEDAQGNVVMTQMLMAGDRYQVPNKDGLVVIARDGGLLSYEIDGKERGLLGTPGEILVGRPLDIATLAAKG